MNVRAITKDVFYVGASDRKINLFENIYPLPTGMSYNSYLIKDKYNALIDTVDEAVASVFYKNLEVALGREKLDYIIVNHIEPDHAATLERTFLLYPEAKLVGTAKTKVMFQRFFTTDIENSFIVVKDNDEISLGEHTLQFYTAPMVHWPEVMVTYEVKEKIMFSADAFGAFGSLNGLFNDEVDFGNEELDEARRYYFNIVGKYGNQVISLLNKIAKLEISLLCPLHGYVWRNNIGYFVDKYKTWGSYQPEEKGVAIIYGSIYGNTAYAADILSTMLREEGAEVVKVYDSSKIDVSVILAEAFRYSHIVFASSTYNNGIYTKMENFIIDLKAHNFQNRYVAIIENGSWAPASGKLMTEQISTMKNLNVIPPLVTIESAVKSSSIEKLRELAKEIVKTL